MWCKYRNAEEAGNLDKFKHKHSIAEGVMEEIKPVYRGLAHPDLLRKCLHGKTQNVNEAFKSTIWIRAPKNVCLGFKALQLSVSDTVIT